MNESTLKEELRALAEEAISRVSASDHPSEYFGGKSAVLDPERDQILTELPTFEGARTALDALPMVQERYGSAPRSEWLALQFVYGFLGDLSEPTFDQAVFETTWEAFWEELSEPEWVWLGLANLRNFRSQSPLLDLGDGITIRDRSSRELSEMGWSETQLNRLSEERYVGANSSHVIIIEHRSSKTPDNFAGMNDLVVQQKVESTVLALRLLKDGDIGIGRIALLRPASFNLVIGGEGEGYLVLPTTNAARSFNEYTLNESDLPSVRNLYNTVLPNTISRFKGVRDRAPVNLDLTLQSFSDIYGREAFRSDTRLVDTITATEALLGAGTTELRFRLAFRIAAILGKDYDERVAIFEQIKSYYDTRSSVVHGSELGKKLGKYLENQQALRAWLRQLLLGFLRLSTSPEHSFNKKFFVSQLDIALVDNTTRSKLRIAMGLEENCTKT